MSDNDQRMQILESALREISRTTARNPQTRGIVKLAKDALERVDAIDISRANHAILDAIHARRERDRVAALRKAERRSS